MHVIVYTGMYYSVGLSILYSKIPLLIMLFKYLVSGNCFCLANRYPCVCVCLSVSVYVRPQAIKNHSHEMKPELPIKQVLLLFSFFVWHLLSILLML